MQTTTDYLELVKQRKAEKAQNENELIKLDMPSGATFLILPISIAQAMVGGGLPLDIMLKMDSVKNAPKKDLSEKELGKIGLKWLEYTRDVMLNNLIFPKISLTDEPDSIAPIDIDPEDFDFFMKWLRGGGQAAQNSKSQPTAGERKRVA